MGYTKKDIGLMAFYEYYKNKELSKNRVPLDYKVFAPILRDINLTIRDLVLDGKVFVMPYKTGRLFIRKFENRYDEDTKYKWAVNYPETKKNGFVVYHGSQYGYRWYWEKKSCNVTGKKHFKFFPSRKAKRLIADNILRKNLDYFTAQ